MPKKTYLGDGVYVDTDGNQLMLTTEDGVSTTNTIYLDNYVLAALNAYVERLREEGSDA